MSDCPHTKLCDGYYGHVCAACGVLIYPYGSEPWLDVPDEEEPHGSCEVCGGEWGDGWSSCRCEDDEEAWFDCGWVRGQGCTKAGSEECDWECPHRRDFERGMRLTQARLAERHQQPRVPRSGAGAIGSKG